MKACFVTAAVLAFAGAAPLVAQDLTSSKCPNSTIAQHAAQDACQQAYDLFQYMAPQLGIAIAGGNATLGQGGTLGGLGHFSVGVRGNVFNGQLPQVSKFTQSVNGAQQSTLPTESKILGLPTADVALGIFKGIPLGLTNILGIDVLGSGMYVPTITSSNGLTVTPNSNWQFGYGGRVGILQESLLVPGISVTYLQRNLPTTSISGTSGTGGQNTLTISNMAVKTTAWRLVAGKSFIVFGLAAGVGQDKYDESADMSANVSGFQAAVSGAQTLTRTNYFADLSLNLPLFKLVGEVGQVSGGSVATYNSFSGGRADRSQVYGSAGLRLAW